MADSGRFRACCGCRNERRTFLSDHGRWIASRGVSRQLTQWLGQDLDPAWDPTGQYITYSTTRFSGGGRYDLATLKPYGTGIVGPAEGAEETGAITLPTPDN